MDVIFSASIIASFFAGMVALFAPCCITVLLPAYLGSAFREKKSILKMTFIFFAGISVVIIPIGLGVAGLADVFKDFHKELYIFGGSLMVILAIMAVLGKGVAMIPMPKRMSLTGKGASHPKSVFLLGVFSGAATACCAPVLAGAATLAIISGAFWKALFVMFAYIFGMTIPLFIAAYFYDKFKIEKSKLIQGKILEFKMPSLCQRLFGGRKTLLVHSTNLLAGVIFLGMGAILLFLAFSGNAFWSPSFQASIGDALNQWSQELLKTLMKVSDIIWSVIIGGLFLFLVLTIRKKTK